MINGHDGGRRPSFLGLWSGRMIGLSVAVLMLVYAFHH